MSQPNVGAAQKAAGKPRRQETGPPPPPTGLSRQAAAKKAARLLGSTDSFTIGKLAQSFGSLSQKSPGGDSSKKGDFSGVPGREEGPPESPLGSSPNPYRQAFLLESGQAGGLGANEGGEIGGKSANGDSIGNKPKGVEGSKKGNLKSLTPEEREARKKQLAEKAKIRALEAKAKKWSDYLELTKVLEPSDADFPTLLASMKFMGQPLSVDFMVAKSGEGQLPVELSGRPWHPPYAAPTPYQPSEDQRARLVFWYFLVSRDRNSELRDLVKSTRLFHLETALNPDPQNQEGSAMRKRLRSQIEIVLQPSNQEKKKAKAAAAQTTGQKAASASGKKSTPEAEARRQKKLEKLAAIGLGPLAKTTGEAPKRKASKELGAADSKKQKGGEG